MPLVKAKCTECGAGLEVENFKDAAICPYCGTAYIVDKAIQLANKGSSADYDILAGVLLKYNGASRVAVIPDGVYEIGKRAFSDCKGLIEVDIPNSVKTISDRAFEDCSSLQKVGLHTGLEIIGERAFARCNSLTDLIIPDTVNEISNSAFLECINLQKIYIPSSVSIIGEHAFSDCSNLFEVAIPNTLKELSSYLFYGCKKLKNITLPSDLKSIAGNAFHGCEALSQITIPASVTSIGKGAFTGCKSIQNIELPKSIDKIEDKLFSGCILLDNFVIPEGVKAIGEYAFNGCESLSQILIPSSVTLIGKGAFAGCKTIRNIELPKSIDKLDDGLFSDCFALDNIIIPDCVKAIGKEVFMHTAITEISIPKCLLEFGSLGDSNIKKIVYPDNCQWNVDSFGISKSANGKTYPHHFDAGTKVFIGNTCVFIEEYYDFVDFKTRFVNRYFEEKNNLLSLIIKNGYSGRNIATKSYYYGLMGRSHNTYYDNEIYYILETEKSTYGYLGDIATVIIRNDGQIFERHNSVESKFTNTDDYSYMDHILFKRQFIAPQYDNDHFTLKRDSNKNDDHLSVRYNGYSFSLDFHSYGRVRIACYSNTESVPASLIESFINLFFLNYENEALDGIINKTKKMNILIEDYSKTRIR